MSLESQDTLVAGPLGGGDHGAGRRTEDDPNLVIDESVRRLRPTECERLQGFPDGWTVVDGEADYIRRPDGKWRLVHGTPDSVRYAALGNAVTVPVAEWIGRRLLAGLTTPTVGPLRGHGQSE